MSPERYSELKAIFQRAVELPDEQRDDYLQLACGADAELRSEVKTLLAAHALDVGNNVFDKPLGKLVAELRIPPNHIPNHRVGAYRLERLLGEGGMGAVYEASRADDQFSQRVALKLVKGSAYSEAILHRFLQERQILASLTHPHIARLLDGGLTPDGQPFFVMEYVEGQPIDQYCNEKRLGIRERLVLFRDVCETVHYAHQNLVVHRDLKPGNILVTSEGEVKLLDFGIAKLLLEQDDGGAKMLTRTGMRLMTPEYASPEQVLGATVATTTDVYSLGIILYELLTGTRPFDVRDRLLSEIERIVCEEHPPKPSAAVRQTISTNIGDMKSDRLRRTLTGDLDNIVLLALRKEPERRYPSAEALSQDIRRYLQGEPVTAHPPTFNYRAAKFIRRHRTPVVAACLLLLSLTAGIAATWRQKVKADNQAALAGIERARAEARFNDVRRLAKSVVFDLHDAIANLAGATKARELIVSKGLEYLDSLAKDATSDPALQLELAASYLRIGNVQGYPNDANRGDIKSALTSYEKALAIGNAIPRSEPINEALDRTLSVVHQRLGEVLIQLGRIEEALKHQEVALKLMEGYALKSSADFETRHTHAVAYVKVGEILESMGRSQEALAQYTKAKPLVERNFADGPDHPEAKRYASVIHSKVGDVLRILGNPQAALQEYRTGLDLRVEAAAADPDNAKLKRDLATSYDRIAMALAESGQPNEALEYELKTMAIDKQLADPANADSEHDLANDHQSLGDLYTRLNRAQDALRSHSLALTIREQLAHASPDNQELQAEMAQARGFVGTLLARVGARTEALDMCERAIDVAKRVYLHDPSNATFHELLANLYAANGEIAAENRQTTVAATALLRKSHSLYRELQSGGKLSSDGAAQLAKVEQQLKTLTGMSR